MSAGVRILGSIPTGVEAGKGSSGKAADAAITRAGGFG